MAWYRCGLNGGGGGGGTGKKVPTFSETLIMDNSAEGTTLAFTADWGNYTLLKVRLKNTSTGDILDIYTTPQFIADAKQYSNGRATFNFPVGDTYVTYTVNNYGTDWVQYGTRNSVVTHIYGLTCTNYTMQIDTIYRRQGIGSTLVTVTSQDSLYDYDYLIIATNTSSYGATEPMSYLVPAEAPTNIQPIILYNYYNGSGSFVLSEYGMTAGRFFVVQGMKLT